jgi:hypothetical protein
MKIEKLTHSAVSSMSQQVFSGNWPATNGFYENMLLI